MCCGIRSQHRTWKQRNLNLEIVSAWNYIRELAADTMGSKCELSYMSPVGKWETPSRRPRSEISASRLCPPGAFASHVIEPPSASSKPSGQHLGDKILKLLKLRKKSNSKATIATLPQGAFQPSLQTFRFQDQSDSKRFANIEDVTERYHYDSDEHAGSAGASGACDRANRNSCSNSCSTSSRSSSCAQSFSSSASRSGTPRSSLLLASHQSNAQLMANILISISHMDEDDEHGIEFDHPALNGPHESAWHQPRDEILEESPRGRHISAAKQSSGRNTPRAGRSSLDQHLTSPGPSRRFGKLDLSKLEKLR